MTTAAETQPTTRETKTMMRHASDCNTQVSGYCAILADDAALDGAEVRVFDVPDVDEGQLAAAMFACDAMNQHERYVRLLKAAKLLIAMNNCNYDRDQMRRSGGFDAVAEAVEAIQPNWAKSTKEQTNGTR